MISIPLQIYVISQQASNPHTPYSWDLIHDLESWNTIEMLPSNGSIGYTRYIWLASAAMVFVFFGFGRDASRTYANGLRVLGFDKCFPFLRTDQVAIRNTSQTGTLDSISSKTKMMFGRKVSSGSPSVESWAIDSRSSKTTSSSMAEPLSPKAMKHLEAFQDSFRYPESPAPVAQPNSSRLSAWLGRRGNTASDPEKGVPPAPKSGFQRLSSSFRPLVESDSLAVPVKNIMKTHHIVVHTFAARTESENIAPLGHVMAQECKETAI
jgi:hypothetical protein